MPLLNSFMNTEDLTEVTIEHPTYHHFCGNGESDSHLDRLLYSDTSSSVRQLPPNEVLGKIICQSEEPLVESHHDVILSSCYLNNRKISDKNVTIEAPRVKLSRHRVKWTDDGIAAYQESIAPHLKRLQELWLSSSTRNCLSLLMESTNNLLTTCAKASNDSLSLPNISPSKFRPTPLYIKSSSKRLLKLWRDLKHLRTLYPENSCLVIDKTTIYKQEKLNHSKLVRAHNTEESFQRDSKLLSDPKSTYA